MNRHLVRGIAWLSIPAGLLITLAALTGVWGPLLGIVLGLLFVAGMYKGVNALFDWKETR